MTRKEKHELMSKYPSRYVVPDDDVAPLICAICLDIRGCWDNVALIRKRYCMLLELVLRYNRGDILQHVLEYHVESGDDGRWLRRVYDSELEGYEHKMLEIDDYDYSKLSAGSLKLMRDYCKNVAIEGNTIHLL